MKPILLVLTLLMSAFATADMRVQIRSQLNEAGIGYSESPLHVFPALIRGERVVGCAVARKKKLDEAVADIQSTGGCKAYPFDVTVTKCDLDRNEPAAAFLVRGYGIYHHRYIAFCIIDSPYGPDEIPDDLPADKVSYLTARFKGFELPSSGVLWFSNGVASVDPTLGSELLCSFKASQHDRPYTKNRQGRPYYDSEHRLLEVETGNSSVRWKLWTGSIMNVYDTHEGELTCRSRGADRQIVTVGEIRKALGPYLVCLRKTHYFCDGGGSSGLTGENK